MGLKKLNIQFISINAGIQRKRGIIRAIQRQLNRRDGKTVSLDDESQDAEYLGIYAGISPDDAARIQHT